MITAKTNDGFEIELSEDALDDAELLDALGGMQDGNVFDMSHLTLRLLGKEGRKKLYDHLRTPGWPCAGGQGGGRSGRADEQLHGRKKLCILAELIASDEDALICDFAQYYHVLDWRALPLRLAATLAAGLPETSRSLRKATGRTVDFETELLAYAADRLTQVLWWLHNDTSKPPSVLADLRGEADSSNVQSYASAEEFDAALAALKGG